MRMRAFAPTPAVKSPRAADGGARRSRPPPIPVRGRGGILFLCPTIYDVTVGAGVCRGAARREAARERSLLPEKERSERLAKVRSSSSDSPPDAAAP